MFIEKIRKICLKGSVFGFVLSSTFLLAGEDLALSQEKKEEEIFASNLKGIVLYSPLGEKLSAAQVDEVNGVEIIGIDVPGMEGVLENELAAFLGAPITEESVQEIKKIVTDYFVNLYYPFTLVRVPNQKISTDVLQLEVVESRLGEIKIEGNQKWSSFCQVREAIQIREGCPIDQRTLMKNINFLNKNPYRKVQGVFEPGKDPYTTDLLVLVEDRAMPIQVYMGTGNTGIKITKTLLSYAGFSIYNCMRLGHILSYQYTTSDFSELQAHTLQYLAPLSNQHILNLYGGYSTFNPEILDTDPFINNQDGYAIQTSGRYSIPLMPTRKLKSEVSFGFDLKRTNTNVQFSSDLAIAPFFQTVNLTQWMISYSGSYQEENYSLKFINEVFFSPFKWLPDQTNSDFEMLRPGTQNTWIYGRSGLYYYQNLPHSCYLALSFRGQMSSAPLLPSEQLGLGGFDTVRGYNERVINQDNAYILSGEFYAPSVSVIRHFYKKRYANDQLQFLFFLDFSQGTNIKQVPGTKKSEFLLGTGPGLRYSIENNLFCRLDWGIRLHKNNEIGTGFGILHFSIVASY